MRIILASASPRRRELLRQIGLSFEVCVTDADEKADTSDPVELVEQLSCRKAEAAASRQGAEDTEDEQELIIGADTIVVCDGRILGKPAGREEAIDMLKMLQGRKHQVYTGVTLLLRGKEEKRIVFHGASTVEFYPMTEREIREYVGTMEPMDKAGSYGIQGICARYIKGIEGDYNNIVGLPVGKLYQNIKQLYVK